MIEDMLHTSSETLPLFDHGQHAKATKAEAYTAAKTKLPKRAFLLLAWLADRDTLGGTRHEGAAAFSWPLSSICGPAQRLLLDGFAEETGKRKSPFGSPAAVMVITEAGRQELATDRNGDAQ